MESQKSGQSNIARVVLFVFSFFFLSQGLGAILMYIFGVSTNELGELQTRYSPELLKPGFMASQFLATAIGLLIVPYFFLKKSFPYLATEINTNTFRNFPVFIALGIVLIITAMPAVSALGNWNTNLVEILNLDFLIKWEAQVKKMYDAILHFDSIADLVIGVIVIAVLPGVAEEFIFRGVLQNELRKIYSPHLAILVSAFIFSFIHFQFTGLIPRWYLGILLGYMYFFSGNIYLSMFIHFINNFVAIMAYYLHQHGHIQTSPEKLDSGMMPIPVVIASFCFGALILIRMWRMRNSSVINSEIS